MQKEVFILTKAKSMQKEEFVDVFSSIKGLEKYLRKEVSQYIKKDSSLGNIISYTDGRNDINRANITFYFAHKKIVRD